MFEKILDAIIDGSCSYRLEIVSLIILNNFNSYGLTYSVNYDIQILTTMDCKCAYYKDTESGLIYYRNYDKNEKIEYPKADAPKDEWFNFNLMHVLHSSELADKLEKTFSVLNNKYKELNENYDFDLNAMKKLSGF